MVFNKIKLWYYRNFNIILTEHQALQLDLKWYCNVYGDNINHLNCRSVYIDEQRNFYKIQTLNN